jgi:hypothetical protein
VFLAGGMDIFRAMRLLIPPAMREAMDPDLRAFLQFNSMHQDPGMAAGMLPATANGLLQHGSQWPAAGATASPTTVFTVAGNRRLGLSAGRISGAAGSAREMIAVDTETGKF